MMESIVIALLIIGVFYLGFFARWLFYEKGAVKKQRGKND